MEIAIAFIASWVIWAQLQRTNEAECRATEFAEAEERERQRAEEAERRAAEFAEAEERERQRAEEADENFKRERELRVL